MTPTPEQLRAAGVGEPAIQRWLASRADARGTPVERDLTDDRPVGRGEGAPPPISEAEEQRRIRRDAIRLGARVYWLSQARKTQQTAGLPDLWVVWPGRLGLWWECKAEDGRRTAQQEQFAAEVAGTGTAYGYGTHGAFLSWCRATAAMKMLPFTPEEVDA